MIISKWAKGLTLGLTMSFPVFAGMNGAELSFIWAVPFIGLLLSIALFPLFLAKIWHHHFGKITLLWSAAFIIPFALQNGLASVSHELLHTFLAEYLPFIILLSSLFAVAGGIYVRGNLQGTPLINTAFLAIGTFLASFTGTTGAAMLLIRPLLRANEKRQHKTHVFVFFIFLVANIGGSLTPLGDPPLFLGFLKGVHFLWTFDHMLPVMATASAILLAVFYVLDCHFYRKDLPLLPQANPNIHDKINLEGKINFVLLLAIVGAVLMSGMWKSGIEWDVAGVKVAFQEILRDAILVAVIALSLSLTPGRCRAANAFNWGPMQEVGKLFAGIFVTMIPVLAMLKAGEAGAFSAVTNLVTAPDGSPINVAYFWLTGALSSFLDNAPTYLVFFNLAGGNAQTLMTTLAPTLIAISCGAVFMGANSYIGNAPNFMVKAIVEDHNVKMPSFFGYIAWSCLFLIPTFLVVSYLFFM